MLKALPLWIFIFATAFLAFRPDCALAAKKRVALLITNGEYEHLADLQNTVNDAKELRNKLSEMHFKIHFLENGGLIEQKKSIDEFFDDFADADLGIFYYAGHAVSLNGFNYLIPSDASEGSITNADRRLISVTDILANKKRNREGKLLVFLDSCRNSPFQSASSNVGRGLSIIPILPAASSDHIEEGNVENILVAFSTQPGNVAVDGLFDQTHSPFTSALINFINEPIELRRMLTKVRRSVALQTEYAQIPWEQNSLIEDIFLSYHRPRPDLGQDGAGGILCFTDRLVLVKDFISCRSKNGLVVEKDP